MKTYKIFSLLLSTALILMISIRCEMPEQWDIKNNGKSAANMYPETSLPFFKGETSIIAVPFNTFENEGVTVTSTIVTKQLFMPSITDQSAPVSYTVEGDDFQQTSEEMFADVPVGGEVQTEETMSAGDYWTLSYQMTVTEGPTLTAAPVTTILFTCPSDLAGKWDALGSGSTIFGTFPPGLSNTSWDGTGEITFLDKGAGTYELDLCCGAFYPEYWGGAAEVVTFRDLCGNYSIDSKTDQWAYLLWFDSVVNNPDGTITVTWENGYEDKGVYTLTRQ